MCAGYTLPLALCAGPMGGGAIGHPAIVSGHLLTAMLVGTYLLRRKIRNEYQMLHLLYTVSIMLS
jgi:hypothetical protein